MKENKLYSAMGQIDDKLIDEAVNCPEKKRIPVKTISAIAAALVLAAVSVAFLMNRNTQPEATVAVTSPSTNTTAPTTPSSEAEPRMNETSTPSAIGGDEESDMLGFIIKDGKTYMQVFYDTEYTIDREIGFARDYPGYYRDLNDDSKVYTVKEDERILLVRFASGGSVTLMLMDDDAQDQLGYYRFHGLRVDRSLMAALLSNDGKVYSVSVTRPDSDDMYDYIYNGRTLREIKAELDESWKTEHGKTNPLDEEFQVALDAFLKEKITAIYEILVTNGIDAEIINGVRCEITVTKEQLEAFAETGSYDEYAFGLLTNGYLFDPEA